METSQQDSYQEILLTVNLEMWDLSLVTVFQDTLPLRSGITHLQLQVIDYPKDFSSLEFQTETLWCCLGNRTPSDPSQKKVHFWNSPLYIGLLIGKIERQHQAESGIFGTRLDIFGPSQILISCFSISVQSQLLLDVLRFEWSPNLMPIIIAVQKYEGIADLRFTD